jgi:alanine dehydrogenase
MGGTWITDLRTGVAGAIASKYLAKKDPKSIGFVGAGAQAKTQFLSHLNYYKNIETIKVWSRSKESIKAFLEFIKTKNITGLNLIPCKSVKEAVIESDVIISTTPSTKPLILEDWISGGVHINCIGADAPGKQELDPKILMKSKIVLDDWEQGCHSGEINVPLTEGLIAKSNVYGDICEIVAGLKPGRTLSNEITVFTSTGLAVQDAATANIAYKKALKENLGEYIDYTP